MGEQWNIDWIQEKRVEVQASIAIMDCRRPHTAYGSRRLNFPKSEDGWSKIFAVRGTWNVQMFQLSLLHKKPLQTLA